MGSLAGVITRVVIWFLWHGLFHWITWRSCDKVAYRMRVSLSKCWVQATFRNVNELWQLFPLYEQALINEIFLTVVHSNTHALNTLNNKEESTECELNPADMRRWQRRINVNAPSWRYISVGATFYKHRVRAGNLNIISLMHFVGLKVVVEQMTLKAPSRKHIILTP